MKIVAMKKWLGVNQSSSGETQGQRRDQVLFHNSLEKISLLYVILPTILFFLVAYFCFQKQLSLWIVLCASFAVWVFAAFLHQWLLK